MKKEIIVSLIIALFLCTGLISCSKDSPSGPGNIKEPYGYDKNFDYLSLLQSSPKYAYESPAGYPVFTYQDASDEKLAELRNTYNLEKVSGDGDEISKIFNLLRWVNQTIRHDGNSSSPDPENSLNILKYCKETGNGVNCVMMAIVLNEVYLSMGFKSRVISGNCRDYVFTGEWHAFNIVYSQSLDKWVFVDPTNQAYFTDDNGNFLSVAEVRKHIKDEIPLHLNESAVHNWLPIDEGSYIHYMSKNLYRFSCSLRSAFGNYGIFSTSGVTNKTFCHLDPENDRQNGLNGALNYFTSNPDYYWKKP